MLNAHAFLLRSLERDLGIHRVLWILEQKYATLTRCFNMIIWKKKSLIFTVNSVLNGKIVSYLSEILVYKLYYLNCVLKIDSKLWLTLIY